MNGSLIETQDGSADHFAFVSCSSGADGGFIGCTPAPLVPGELLYNILQQRNLNTFDSSLLVDFSEKPLIQGAILVTRIIPLVKHPGCLFITSKRVYFQPAPLNNVRYRQRFKRENLSTSTIKPK